MTKAGRNLARHTVVGRRLSAFVIGRTSDLHFHPAIEVLERHATCCFEAPCEASLILKSDDPPALCVLLQSHPGEFSQTAVDELRRRWPLARIVAIAGSWCEGEPRTGGNLAGVYRMTWDIAAARLSTELPKLAAGLGAFSLPPTTTAEERTTIARSRDFDGRPLIAVAARRVSAAEPVIDALHAAGAAAMFYSLNDPPMVRGVDAVVWDIAGCEGALEAFHAKLPRAAGAIVAVCDFPRPQDVRDVQRLGIASILGRPLQIDDLVASSEAALPQAHVANTQHVEVA